MSIIDTTFPRTKTFPLVGCVIPANIFSKVVFPEPLFPITPTLSPCLMLIFIFFNIMDFIDFKNFINSLVHHTLPQAGSPYDV